MFLDFSVAFILIYDFLELIGSHIESVSISIPFLIFFISFITVSIFAWRSTYIPALPPVPRPPYVIQISSIPTLNNNGERNTLADVRLLSSGVDVDNLRRNFPTISVRDRPIDRYRLRRYGTRVAGLETIETQTGGAGSDTAEGVSSTTTTTAEGQGRTQIRYHQVRQRPAANQSGSGTALLQGLLRPGSVIRPLLQRASGGGNQVQNLIVYHRVNVYHHHHHHHHSEHASLNSTAPSQPLLSASQNIQNQSESITEEQSTASLDSNSVSNGLPEQHSNRSSRSHSVDSSTQYEYTDGNVEEGESYEQLIDGPNDVDVLLNVEDAENSSPADIEAIEGIDNQDPIADVGQLGLRHRRSVHFSDIQSDNNSLVEDNNSQPPTTTTSPIIMDKSETVGQIPVSPSSSDGVNDIRFTIKFLNDTQLEVTTQTGEKIADFKRRHFATELAENKTVRLIFNGRVLDNDASTLRESGIFDQCVVHCLIVSRPPPPPANGNSSTGSRGTMRANAGILRGGTAEPGIFFVGFVGVFLIFLWFICFHFGQHLFSQSAVISLTLLTLIFCIGLVAFYLPVHPANHPAA